MGNEEAEIVNSTVKLRCGESLLLKLGGAYVLVTPAPAAPSEPTEAPGITARTPCSWTWRTG